MDAFEHLVSRLLWRDGYWVQTSVRVDLTHEEKRRVKNPTIPRPELDIVAYNATQNVLLIVECKSYMDSVGVLASAFNGKSQKQADRYKLFTRRWLREVVLEKLRIEMLAKGLCREGVEVRLGMACGLVKKEKDREFLWEHFAKNKWEFMDERWVRERLSRLPEEGYENSIESIVAKLLLR